MLDARWRRSQGSVSLRAFAASRLESAVKQVGGKEGRKKEGRRKEEEGLARVSGLGMGMGTAKILCRGFRGRLQECVAKFFSPLDPPRLYALQRIYCGAGGCSLLAP